MNKINIITVVQARTGSARLPGKTLLPVLDTPLIIRMIERVKFSSLADNIVVATSKKKEDDVIEELCFDMNVSCFRGSEEDLLDRHYQAGKIFDADAVAKIPSDCPLIDFRIIDKVYAKFIENFDSVDFVSNLHPATFPDGNDVEIVKFTALEKAWKSAKRKLEREHTTPYIWENSNLFNILNVTWDTGLNYSLSHRWTIDYWEDYQFIKTVYEKLYPINRKFGLKDILNLLEKNPDIAEINSKYAGRYWYENHLTELKNIEEYKNALNKINADINIIREI